MPSKIKDHKILLLSLTPFFLAVLIMVPRLVSAQFSLLDDGIMLVNTQRILDRDFTMAEDLQAGRLRPFYWFYYTLIYLLAGMNPFWFYVGHLALFLILLLQIRLIMKTLEATHLQIFITSLAFILAMPIIENFYTLSKGEPLQLVFLLAAVLTLLKPARKIRLWRALLIFICTLSAILVKETALAIVPLALAWWLFLHIRAQKTDKSERQSALAFFMAAAGAAMVYLIIRRNSGAAPLTGGTYTEKYSLSFEAILANAKRWVTQLAFYFNYLIPLLIVFVLIAMKREFYQAGQNRKFVFWVLWTLFWVISFLPWGFAEIYYLLPFSLGIAFLVGLISPWAGRLTRESNKGIRLSAYISLGAAFILLILTLGTYRTHAMAQLAIDDADQQMLAYTSKNTPENGRVFIGLETEKEYVQNIRIFLQDHYRRADITFDFVSVKTLERLHWYPDGILVLPKVIHLPDLLPRTGVDETFTMAWAEVILHTMEGRLKGLQEFNNQFRLSSSNLPVITCMFFGDSGFSDDPDPVFDTRVFTYGWDIYQIK